MYRIVRFYRHAPACVVREHLSLDEATDALTSRRGVWFDALEREADLAWRATGRAA